LPSCKGLMGVTIESWESGFQATGDPSPSSTL
jgi:hypothetical protein